jgi:hypothetical protein
MPIEKHQHSAEDVLIDLPNYKNVKSAIEYLASKEPIVNLYSSIKKAEFGQTISDITLTWNVVQDSITELFLSEVGKLDPKLRGYTFSNQKIKSNKSYTLSYSNGYFRKNATIDIVFSDKIYWGLSYKESLLEQEVFLLNSELNDQRNQSRTFYANNDYIYFVFPTSYGKPIFKFNGIINSAWELKTLFLENCYGLSQPYSIYRSTFKQSGKNIVIDVS